MAMDLLTWSEVVAVLYGFMFNPTAYEIEERWFNKALDLVSTSQDNVDFGGVI
jgi:hypothetical protein